MKEYSVQWDPSKVYPEVTREYLGLLPEFFISATQKLSEYATLDHIAQVMDDLYQFGGFRYPFGGTVADSGAYQSYPYAITAIRDNDTGETKIGRFD
jgi:hypothetical protein